MATWTTKLFDEIHVGDRATLEHVVDAGDIELLAMLTGDRLALDRTQAAAVRSTQAVGARVPIALTSRADNARSREASTAVMALVAHARRAGAV